MTCTAVRDQLSGYVDGELPREQAMEVAEHLAGCAPCSREYQAMLDTVQALRDGLGRYRAPDVLRQRIRSAIRDEQVAHTPPATRRRRTQWWAIAAALVLVAASSTVTRIVTSRSDAAPALADEVLASHVRSLMPSHLTDVQSSNQHNVKPWFNGRLDFAPGVPQLDAVGFPLIGGRVDYVDSRPVAVLVYGRGQHVINVFTWPARGESESSWASTRNGFHLVRWQYEGMQYWCVSDLKMSDLQQFAVLFKRNEPTTGAEPPTPGS